MLIDLDSESDVQAPCPLLRRRRLRTCLITICLPAIRELPILITIIKAPISSDSASVPSPFTTLRLSDNSIIPTRHRQLIKRRILLHPAWVFPKQRNQRLAGVVIEMVHFVAPRQQIGDRFGRRMVRDRAADDVGHVPMVFLLRQAQFGMAVEGAERGEVDVAAEDGDANGVFGRQLLQGEDEVFALALVLSRGVVVVQVVEEVRLAVEFVEEAACDAEAFVEEADGADEGGGEDLFEPGEAWVGDWDAEEDDEVLDGLV